jgi:hypothetical protein
MSLSTVALIILLALVAIVLIGGSFSNSGLIIGIVAAIAAVLLIARK